MSRIPDDVPQVVVLSAAATATGTAGPQGLPSGKKTFQLAQTVSSGTATSALQCSVDKSSWKTIFTQTVAAATGNDIVEVDSDVPFWRVVRTGMSANASCDASVAF